MNDSKKSTSLFAKHFCGASPALRCLPGISVAALLLEILQVAILRFSPEHAPFLRSGLLCMVAFVAGISSFCPLGGISAFMATVVVIVFANAAASLQS